MTPAVVERFRDGRGQEQQTWLRTFIARLRTAAPSGSLIRKELGESRN
jgi:hypothetical protein